jgi:hypothetical protein
VRTVEGAWSNEPRRLGDERAEANGPRSGKRSLSVSFTGAGSTDPDGAISWSSGDGSVPGTGPDPTRSYPNAGTFTVTDNQGGTDTDTTLATVTR